MVNLKPNLKEHTPLSHTGDNPLSARLVSTWPELSSTWKSILHWFIEKRNFPLQFCAKIISPKFNIHHWSIQKCSYYILYILWQLVQYEPKPLEAYYTELYWSDALLCTFCETGKCEEKPWKAYFAVPCRRDAISVICVAI